MKEINIVIENGSIEKKIIISSGVISFDSSENSVVSQHNISTILIAGNGAFSPPFIKGSKVLNEIRSTSGKELSTWKLVFPLFQNETDFFRFPGLKNEQIEKLESRENWGIWICESQNSEDFPDILLINFPLWLFSRGYKDSSFSKLEYEDFVSRTYRIVLGGLNAVLSFNAGPKIKYTNGALVLSDIGNNLIDRNFIAGLDETEFLQDDIHKSRIRIFTQVLSDWMLKSDFFSKAIISYGNGVRMDLIERAWDQQAEESKDDIAEYGDAITLRTKNAEYLKALNRTVSKLSMKTVFEMAMETFSSAKPSLAADLIQSRTLVEAIALELCNKFELNVQEGNFWGYIDRLEKSKRVSPWITSYMHVIRQLGNEAAHYKREFERRPEKPVGKDLIVIHAALNRILSFCSDEF